MGLESRNPRSFGLDKMAAKDIVRLMNEEEHIVLRAMQSAEHALACTAEKVAEVYQKGGRIIYLGAGTSGRVAAIDAAEIPPTFGVEEGRFVVVLAGGSEALQKSKEGAEDDEVAAITSLNDIGLSRNDIVIALSASGRTPYILAGVRHAKQKGIWTAGIANARNTSLLEEVDLPILLDTGPEVVTGSTRLKGGTSQKLALNMISTCAMVLCGKVVENLMVDVIPKNNKLKGRCVRIVRELTTATEDEAREYLEKNNWNVRQVLALLRPSPVNVK